MCSAPWTALRTHDVRWKRCRDSALCRIGRELLKLVESLQADMMIVGSRGLTGDTRYLMGSVSDSVVLYAPCAVLVFRQEEGEQERQQEGGTTFGRTKA